MKGEPRPRARVPNTCRGLPPDHPLRLIFAGQPICGRGSHVPVKNHAIGQLRDHPPSDPRTRNVPRGPPIGPGSAGGGPRMYDVLAARLDIRRTLSAGAQADLPTDVVGGAVPLGTIWGPHAARAPDSRTPRGPNIPLLA
jgi:hypothetical protein